MSVFLLVCHRVASSVQHYFSSFAATNNINLLFCDFDNNNFTPKKMIYVIHEQKYQLDV